MKLILILMIGLASFAQAKECKYSLSDDDHSIWSLFKTRKAADREIPDGNCKLVKQDFFIASGYSCENAYNIIKSSNGKADKKYGCYQPALGSKSWVKNGVGVTSIHAICYVCELKTAKK